MKQSSKIGWLESKVEDLSVKEKLRLIEWLARSLGREDITRHRDRDWSSLYGLGKGLWQEEDAQAYVNRSREDR